MLEDVRLFAGIAIPGPAHEHLSRALSMVSPPRRTGRNPWGPSANWHITLAFYGEQPDALAEAIAGNLRSAAAVTPPFDISLAGAGVFRHDVCWIGVHDPGDALGPLADLVRGEYATAHQHTQNRFHITVSRSGRRAGLEDTMAALAVYRGPAWTVDAITLFRSDLGEGVGGHPLYTPLATARLGGA